MLTDVGAPLPDFRERTVGRKVNRSHNHGFIVQLAIVRIV